MPIDAAREIARALNVKSESRIRAIDRALTQYVRLTSQSEVTEVTGSVTQAQLNITSSQTTVGSAGAASALPATPTGYALLTVNGTQRAFPYFDVS